MKSSTLGTAGAVAARKDLVDEKSVQRIRKRAELWARLSVAENEARFSESQRRTSELIDAQLESYSTYVHAQLARAHGVFEQSAAFLDGQAALIELSGKLAKFASFLDHETHSRATSSLCDGKRKNALLSAWGVSPEASMAVSEVWELSNTAWASLPGSRSDAVFSKLPRSMVQRTTVHGLGTLGDVDVKRLFEDSPGIEQQSHVLTVIANKSAPHFPMAFNRSLESVMAIDRSSATAFHFAVAVSTALEPDEPTGEVMASTPGQVVPVAIIVFDGSGGIEFGKDHADLDRRLITAIGKKEEEFAKWVKKLIAAQRHVCPEAISAAAKVEMEEKKRDLERQISEARAQLAHERSVTAELKRR